MRIITGKARGRRLFTLKGDNTRPTTEKVKEAVFSAIQFDIEGRRVLDLFAGSGQMALEAVSRGAESAVLVDIDKDAASVIQKNIDTAGFNTQTRLVCSDFLSFLVSARDKFDLIFLDPPYSMGFFEKAAPLLEKCSSDACTIIYEHPSTEHPVESFGRFSVLRSYNYGKIAVTLYKNN